ADARDRQECRGHCPGSFLSRRPVSFDVRSTSIRRQLKVRDMRRAIATGSIFAGAALAGALIPSAGVLAHAFLDHAAPSVGSTVRGSPAEVRVWFTEALEPAFSTLRVLDQAGAPVDQG